MTILHSIIRLSEQYGENYWGHDPVNHRKNYLSDIKPTEIVSPDIKMEVEMSPTTEGSSDASRDDTDSLSLEDGTER